MLASLSFTFQFSKKHHNSDYWVIGIIGKWGKMLANNSAVTVDQLQWPTSHLERKPETTSGRSRKREPARAPRVAEAASEHAGAGPPLSPGAPGGWPSRSSHSSMLAAPRPLLEPKPATFSPFFFSSHFAQRNLPPFGWQSPQHSRKVHEHLIWALAKGVGGGAEFPNPED